MDSMIKGKRFPKILKEVETWIRIETDSRVHVRQRTETTQVDIMIEMSQEDTRTVLGFNKLFNLKRKIIKWFVFFYFKRVLRKTRLEKRTKRHIARQIQEQEKGETRSIRIGQTKEGENWKDAIERASTGFESKTFASFVVRFFKFRFKISFLLFFFIVVRLIIGFFTH